MLTLIGFIIWKSFKKIMKVESDVSKLLKYAEVLNLGTVASLPS